MTDSGLTDLIAAHHPFGHYMATNEIRCGCGWLGPASDWPEHVALIVEQHTNGRIAELEAENRTLTFSVEDETRDCEGWKIRAEKAEAAIARVITALEAAEKSVPDDWGVTYIYTSQLRAALEGEQQ